MGSDQRHSGLWWCGGGSLGESCVCVGGGEGGELEVGG